MKMEKDTIKDKMLSLGGSQIDKIHQISLTSELVEIKKIKKFRKNILKNFVVNEYSVKSTCEQKLSFIENELNKFLRLESRRIHNGLRR